MINQPLPEKFVKSLEELLEFDDSKSLCNALDNTVSPVSIRFNPYKIDSAPEGRQVPWCRYGFMLDERPQFTLDPLFHAGAYYVQEASSMFIEHIYRSAIGEQEGLKILDLCAAPGGKTTLLSSLAGLNGTVVANDTIRQRAITLGDNVRKWGLGNVVVTNNDPAHFNGFQDYFDVILIDAPCSGEGMFRKDPQARSEWSPANINLCAQRQRRILADIWDSLKPGGILIYSTCTFNRTENEDNIEWLADEYGCEPVEIEIPREWGIATGEIPIINHNKGIATFRFYPQKVEGEGFFAAVMRKPDGKQRIKTPKPRKNIFSALSRPSAYAVSQWVGQPKYMIFSAIGDNIYGYYSNAFATVKILAESLSVIYSGVLMGQLFKGSLRPEHPLALFHDVSKNIVPETKLSLEEALTYLRKQDMNPSVFEEGINMVIYEGFPIGWIKRIGGRVNNMYPKELRILNL